MRIRAACTRCKQVIEARWHLEIVQCACQRLLVSTECGPAGESEHYRWLGDDPAPEGFSDPYTVLVRNTHGLVVGLTQLEYSRYVAHLLAGHYTNAPFTVISTQGTEARSA